MPNLALERPDGDRGAADATPNSLGLLGEWQDPVNAIWWSGLMAQPPDTDLPDPKESETREQYLTRIWTGEELSRELVSRMTSTGINQAAELKESLVDLIQLAVYRAWANGWWIGTDPITNPPEDFRAWVREAATAQGASSTEATQLASTILNLAFLKANSYDGLPSDLEAIFADRTAYNRWRRVASTLRNLIAAAKSDEDVTAAEADEKIQSVIDDVNDTENKTTEDLDRSGRGGPPTVTFTILAERDELGHNIVQAHIPDAALPALKSATKYAARWRLAGETYDVANAVLVQYRKVVIRGTGEVSWHERSYGDGVWSDFYPCASPDLNGRQEGAPLKDPDLNGASVTYYSQWEEL